MLLPPRILYIEVNKRCNLRCVHCDFWKRDDSDRANYLSRERLTEIFEELAAFSPDASVCICGGEPMLDLEDYFFITRECRRLGLRTLSVVNGTRIRDAKMAERVMREGADETSISLNSHMREEHDRTRGVRGAYDKAVKALRLLVAARKTVPGASGRRIYVMGLIHAGNFRQIEEFYDFVLNDVGADKLKLNFAQPTFGHSDDDDPFFEHAVDIDGGELKEVIAAAARRFSIPVNPAWLDNVGMYFDSVRPVRDLNRGWKTSAMTRDHICNTYERNIMVDAYGFARLCFSDAFPGMQLKRRGDVKLFWESADPIRQKMRRCNRVCGISHSVRREASTLTGKAKNDAFRENAEAQIRLPARASALQRFKGTWRISLKSG